MTRGALSLMDRNKCLLLPLVIFTIYLRIDVWNAKCKKNDKLTPQIFSTNTTERKTTNTKETRYNLFEEETLYLYLFVYFFLFFLYFTIVYFLIFVSLGIMNPGWCFRKSSFVFGARGCMQPCKLQSNLIISKSKGLAEILRDIHTSTY